MKLVVLLLFLSSLSANGQRWRDNSNNEIVKKGDSLELLYANDKLLKITSDTLPLESSDENSGWRDMKLVSYYFDTLNVVHKIIFRNGRDGYSYFYFKGNQLRKASVLKKAGLINMQYYYTAEDNAYLPSAIEQKIKQNPGSKDLYELLKRGKAFLEKFKTLLQ